MNTTEILSKYSPSKDNLLLILHDIQNNSPLNYISQDDMAEVAIYLSVPKSSVLGVVSYYSMFSLHPRGKNIIRICNSPICNSSGSVKLAKKIAAKFEVEPCRTSYDGELTLEFCECLGQCHNSPVMMVNRDVYQSVSTDSVNDIIKNYRKKK